MESKIGVCFTVLCCAMIFVVCVVPTHAGESADVDELVASYFDQKSREPSLYDPEFLESVIRYGYERLESLTAAEGAKVDFELDDFKTYRDADFSSLLISDISTLPGGESLQLTLRRVWSHEKDLLLEERLEPRWIERVDQASRPAVKRHLHLRLDEVFEANAEHYPGEVLGVTTYRVRVIFEDKSRSYRANFLWIASREDQESWEDEELRFLPIDHVTIGLITAYSLPTADELEKPASLERKESPVPSDPIDDVTPEFQNLDAEPASKLYGQCTSELKEKNALLSKIISNGHASGGHGPSASIRSSCLCNLQCEQDCKYSSSSEACDENGVLMSGESCHVVSLASVNSSQGFSFDGSTAAAECALGLACSQKSCPACQCIAGAVSITVSGISVSFSDDPDQLEVTATHTTTCSKCPRDEETGSTPIVVNLEGQPLRFSGSEDRVEFDIDADGELESLTWTDPTTSVAFLALDRDADGEIGSGAELFGNYTPQPWSSQPNGFEALKLFDENRDLQITNSDAVFEELLLWLDRNHNGISEPEELLKLADYVESLDLEYRESRRRDRHGNELRYWAWSELTSGRSVHAVDVIFVTIVEDESQTKVDLFQDPFDGLGGYP